MAKQVYKPYGKMSSGEANGLKSFAFVVQCKALKKP
jgi:hypothetical protein